MNWINQIWNRWTKPNAREEDQARRETMTRALLFFMTFTCLGFLLIALVGGLAGIFPLQVFLTTLVVCGLIGLLDVLGLRIDWKPVTYLAPALFFILGVYGSISQGLTTDVGLAYIIAVLLSAILLGNRISWLVLALSIASYAGIGWGVTGGSPNHLAASVITFSIALFSIALLARFAVRQLEKSLQSVHALSANLQREMVAHKHAEVEKLRITEAYRFTLRHMDNNLFCLKKHPNGEIYYSLNEGRFPQKTGQTTDVVYGKTLKEFAGEAAAQQNTPYFERAFRGEFVSYDTDIDGTTLTVVLTPIEINGKIAEVVGRSFDTTRQKQLEEERTQLSTHDALTGLFNRHFFETEMERLQSSQTYPISVLMADIDMLKTINEQLGHSAGDELLRRTAHVLREAFRREDLIARIGGDEFAVLLPGSGDTVCQLVMNRLKTSLSKYNLEHRDLPLELSVGIATAEQGEKISDVLKRADNKMIDEQMKRRKQRSSNLESG